MSGLIRNELETLDIVRGVEGYIDMVRGRFTTNTKE